MKKKLLSEIAIYHGQVKMPEGWDINREILAKDMIARELFDNTFRFSKEWDRLNKYIIEYMNVKYNIIVENKDSWENIFSPHEKPNINCEFNNFNIPNSPDFVLLYGVKIQPKSCFVKIYYDNHRKIDRVWNMPINDNTFIMFPGNLKYQISENTSNKLNLIKTITYESL